MTERPEPRMGEPAKMRAVLFDFDGTLADTAPDLGGALNRMRIARFRAPLPLETFDRLRRRVRAVSCRLGLR